MIKIIITLLLFVQSSLAVSVIAPLRDAGEWVDTATSGSDIRLHFDKIGTTFSFLQVDWRSQNLILFARSEETRAEQIQLVSILGGVETVLVELNMDDESSIPGRDGATFYDYSDPIFFTEAQMLSLRDAELRIIATPVAGSSFSTVPEPSSALFLGLSAAFCLLRRSRTYHRRNSIFDEARPPQSFSR